MKSDVLSMKNSLTVLCAPGENSPAATATARGSPCQALSGCRGRAGLRSSATAAAARPLAAGNFQINIRVLKMVLGEKPPV